MCIKIIGEPELGFPDFLFWIQISLPSGLPV